MAAGLSLRAAAKLTGVSNPAILKAANAGRIARLEDGTIDPASLDVWAAGRRTPRGGLKRGDKPALPANAASVSVDGEAARKARAALEVTLSPGGLYGDRQQAELARDSYAARLKQLDFEERAGKLLDGETVARFIASGCAKVRTRLLALPAERAPAIARLKTAVEVQDALQAAVTEALEELAEHFAKAI